MRNPVAITIPTDAERGREVRYMKWAVLGRDRSHLHLGRKFYHFIMGIACFALYAFALERSQALLMLGIVGGALVIFDVFRFRNPQVNVLALRWFGKMMRREELKSLSGNSFYIAGLFLIVWFFPKPIVLLSTLYLAIGDPIAAIIGTRYGKHKLLRKKSWEGSVANFVLCTLVTYILSLSYFHLSTDQALILSLVGGVVSAFAELLPLPVNDNLTIPVVSAVLLSSATWVLAIF